MIAREFAHRLRIHEFGLIFRRFRKIGKSDYYLRRVSLSVCPSVWNILTATDEFFHNLILEDFSKLSKKFRQE
jgi:hypothetical protein